MPLTRASASASVLLGAAAAPAAVLPVLALLLLLPGARPQPRSALPGPDRSLRSGGGPESVLGLVFQLLEGCALAPSAGSKQFEPITAALGCMLVGAVAEGMGLCDLQGGKWVLTGSAWEQQRRLTSLCTLAKQEGGAGTPAAPRGIG